MWAKASSFKKFLDHTPLRTTVCRNCRNDQHTTSKGQVCSPSSGMRLPKRPSLIVDCLHRNVTRVNVKSICTAHQKTVYVVWLWTIPLNTLHNCHCKYFFTADRSTASAIASIVPFIKTFLLFPWEMGDFVCPSRRVIPTFVTVYGPTAAIACTMLLYSVEC